MNMNCTCCSFYLSSFGIFFALQHTSYHIHNNLIFRHSRPTLLGSVSCCQSMFNSWYFRKDLHEQIFHPLPVLRVLMITSFCFWTYSFIFLTTSNASDFCCKKYTMLSTKVINGCDRIQLSTDRENTCLPNFIDFMEKGQTYHHFLLWLIYMKRDLNFQNSASWLNYYHK